MSVYRVAGTGEQPDAEVTCKACATTHQIALESNRNATFRCRSCQTEQPVLREQGDLDVVSITVTKQHDSNYTELVPFAKLIGLSSADPRSHGLDLTCDGVPIQVSLRIDSGTVRGVEFSVTTSGLPAIRFVSETRSHAEAKSDDIVREVQTGDAEFDAAVFIESGVLDAAVLTVLSAPAVREAIKKLVLTHVEAVELTAKNITLSVDTSKKGVAAVFDPELMRERVQLLRVIVGAPRPLVVSVQKTPAAATLARVAVIAAVPSGVILFVTGVNAFEPVRATVHIVGLVGGLVIAGILQPLITRALSGRSTSQRDIATVRMPSIAAMPFLVTGSLVMANGACDRSPERLVEMPVAETKPDDEDKTRTVVTAFDEVHASHQYGFRVGGKPIPIGTGGTGAAGSVIRVKWRSGALGFSWESSPAILHTPDPPSK